MREKNKEILFLNKSINLFTDITDNFSEENSVVHYSEIKDTIFSFHREYKEYQKNPNIFTILRTKSPVAIKTPKFYKHHSIDQFIRHSACIFLNYLVGATQNFKNALKYTNEPYNTNLNIQMNKNKALDCFISSKRMLYIGYLMQEGQFQELLDTLEGMPITFQDYFSEHMNHVINNLFEEDCKKAFKITIEKSKLSETQLQDTPFKNKIL